MNKQLQFWLSVNAAFSLSSGLVTIFFNNYIQQVFEVENMSVFPVIGVNLILFAIFIIGLIVTYSRSHTFYPNLMYVIIVLDLLWVTGSVLEVSLQWFMLSDIAYRFIILIALVVGFLGFQQFRYVKR